MDDLHRLEARSLARAKLRSQRRRVSRIRRHTIRGSLALFSIFWAVIFAQLVSGNDPALSANRQTTAAQTKKHRHPGPVVQATAPLPTEEPPLESEPAPEAEPAFEEEPPAVEFETLPVEEALPEFEEPIVTSAS